MISNRPTRKDGTSGPLYRLLYCSRSVIAANAAPGTAVDIEHEIERILAVSRPNNAADNVTGALLFTASGFAQVLEGFRETVERTFERIGLDPRHADVSVLAFTPIERRSFPDWAMGFCGDKRTDAVDPLAHLMSDANFVGERATTGSDLLRLLEKLVLQENEWIRG